MIFTSGNAGGHLAALRTFRNWICSPANLGAQAWVWLKDSTGIAGNVNGTVYFRAPGASGVTRVVVEDCEDAWNEFVSGNVTSTLDTSDYQVGSGSASLAVAAPAGAGDILATEAIASANLSSYTRIAFRMKSSVACSAGDLQLLLDNSPNCASPLETLNVPALRADEWTYCEVPFAAPSNLTAVVSIGMKMIVDKGVFTIRIDDVQAFGSQAEYIFTSVNTVSDVGNDWYNWEMNGAIGFDIQQSPTGQPGAIGVGLNTPKVLLASGTMNYRFWANGRAALVAFNVGGVCETGFLGFYTPYGPPTAVPYPMMIGGCHGTNVKYSDVTISHQWCLKHGGSTARSVFPGFVRSAQGTWMPLYHQAYSSLIAGRYFTEPFWRLTEHIITPCVDGSLPVFPVVIGITLSATALDTAAIGEMPDMFYIPGFGIANGDTRTIGGVTYDIVADTFRTDGFSYIAVKRG